MRLHKLNRTVIKVQGDGVKFLNGLTSNSLDQMQNAFLNLHGRIISTFFQKQVSAEEFLIAVPPEAVDPLLAHLDRYARLSGVKLVPTDMKTYFDLDAKDPLLITDEQLPSSVTEEEFTHFRLANDLPLMGVDYQADEFILNVSEHAQVSYAKGCFLGQEPVAKVHSRAKPARKLVVRYADELTEEEQGRMSSKAQDPKSGRIMGFVFVKNA